MLKILMKKEVLELVRGIITDRKTGQKAKKGTIILYIGLFALLFFSFGSMFFGSAYSLITLFAPMGMDWLPMAMMAMMTVGVGLFGSVLTTYTTLYLPKDNEFLLSMPIKPGTILFARIVAVYIMGLLFSACAWIPSLIVQWSAFKNLSILAKLNGVLLLFVINVFTTTLSCLIGWLVALIAVRIPTKRKSVVNVAVTIVFLVAYYYVIGNSNKLLASITANAAGYETSIRGWGYIFYQIGLAATGNAMSMIIFAAFAALTFAICYLLLQKSFIKITTMKRGDKKVEYKEKSVQAQSVDKALMRREIKRFMGISTYMLNTGLGVILAPAAAIVIFVKRNDIATLTEMLRNSTGNPIPFITMMPMIACALVCVVIGMDAMATPSIALEGNTFWIIKTMPVETYKKLAAKSMAQLVVNIIPAIVSILIIAVALGVKFRVGLCMLVVVIVFTMFSSEFCLMLAFYKPDMQWKNIQVPVKQAMNVLFAILGNFVVCLSMVALTFVLLKFTDIVYSLLVVAAALYVGTLLIRRWNMIKGVALFEVL